MTRYLISSSNEILLLVIFMDINRFLNEMECLVPASLADEADTLHNGLIVEGEREVKNICCSLDATIEAIDRVVKISGTMLVVHHPLFWNPLTAVKGYDATILRKLLSKKVNLFVMHTNFDRGPIGVNRTLAKVLELDSVEEMPIGVIGDCHLSIQAIAHRLKDWVRVTGSPKKIKKLAIVGGSGFDLDLIEYAVKQGADGFLSAELKHHVAIKSQLPLIETSHYALEAPAMQSLARDQQWIFIETEPEYREIK